MSEWISSNILIVVYLACFIYQKYSCQLGLSLLINVQFRSKRSPRYTLWWSRVTTVMSTKVKMNVVVSALLLLQPFAEEHLVIVGLKGDYTKKTSDFWCSIYGSLRETIPFTTISCPTNLVEERAAVAKISTSSSSQGELYPLRLRNVTIVIGLVQGGKHCVPVPGDSGNCPSRNNNRSSYKDTLRKGATHVWVGSVRPNMTRLLNFRSQADANRNTSSLVISPNDYYGGMKIGAAFCERAKKERAQHVARLYGKESAEFSTARINGFDDRVAANCNQHKVVFEAYADCDFDKAQRLASSGFLRDSRITSFIAASDNIARGVIAAAHEVRPSGSSGLLVYGCGHDPSVLGFLESGEIAGTIDQLISYPKDRLIFFVAQMLKQIQALHAAKPATLLSSADIIAQFGLGTERKSRAAQRRLSPTCRHTSSREESNSRPQPPIGSASRAVEVAIGLRDLSILQFDYGGGSLTGVG